MDQWRKDARKEPIIIDIDSLVPADHLLRKIERVMDYKPWEKFTLLWCKKCQNKSAADHHSFFEGDLLFSYYTLDCINCVSRFCVASFRSA